MSKLATDVTLICIDCVNAERANDVLKKCLAKVAFANTKLLTSLKTDSPFAVTIPHIGSLEEYSQFVVRELCKYFTTSHCLIVQHDGWIINPSAWDDTWLSYDYVGCFNSNWCEPHDDGKGGNGGFSLRSHKLQQLASTVVSKPHPEDVTISFTYRKILEEAGCEFAPNTVQRKFGIECGECTGQFGHHRGWTAKYLARTESSLFVDESQLMFTIITPTYEGRQKSLSRAINSVQDQLCQSFEHLVIFEKEQYMPVDFPRTHALLVKNPTEWGNEQRRIGLKEAKGKRIVFLDDDNILFPRALKEIDEIFADADVVHSPILYDGRKMLQHSFSHGQVDLLQWCIRTDVARQVEFPGQGYDADWAYFSALNSQKALKIAKNFSLIGAHATAIEKTKW